MRTIFAFDTATSTATCALVRDGELLGERMTTAKAVLAAADELVRDAGLEPRDLDALVVGTGPGQLHVDPDRARDRARPRARARPAGRRRLDARRVRRRHARDRRAPRRGLHRPDRRSPRPEELDVAGSRLVGDGAVRYRDVFEAAGAEVPPDDDPDHRPARAPARRARRRLRPGRRRRARLPPRPGRGAEPMTAVAIELRQLSLAHLGDIEQIEQSAYPTPWSRHDVRLRARQADLDLPRRVRGRPARRLHHQLALRRRLARDERRRRPRPPPPRHRHAAARAPLRADEARRPPRLHARGARLERWARSTSTSASASSGAACGAATTPTTARTRSSCGATPRRSREPPAADRGRRGSRSARRRRYPTLGTSRTAGSGPATRSRRRRLAA